MFRYSLIIILTIGLYSCMNKPSDKSDQNVKDLNESEKLSFNLEGEELPNKVSRPLEFNTVQVLNIDLNNDNKQDTIFIDKIVKWLNTKDSSVYKWTDPGDFHRIRISLNGDKSKTWVNIDGWVKNQRLTTFDNDFNLKNKVNSDFVTVRKDISHGSLIFFNGYPYASRPGLLTIVNITNDELKLIFNKNEFLYKLHDFNNDKLKDLVTSVWGKYKVKNEGKNEFKVYLLNGGFTYNEEYTKEFSQKKEIDD